MYTVYYKYARWSDWEWAWDCETLDKAIAVKKLLRHRGYYGAYIS